MKKFFEGVEIGPYNHSKTGTEQFGLPSNFDELPDALFIKGDIVNFFKKSLGEPEPPKMSVILETIELLDVPLRIKLLLSANMGNYANQYSKIWGKLQAIKEIGVEYGVDFSAMDKMSPEERIKYVDQKVDEVFEKAIKAKSDGKPGDVNQKRAD